MAVRGKAMARQDGPGKLDREEYHRLIDANQQALVHAVFKRLEIPDKDWGDAIEQRGILLLGRDKPWSVTIGTVSDGGALKALFGNDHQETIALNLEVSVVVDSKSLYCQVVNMEVEVGVAGMYNHFKQVKKFGMTVTDGGAASGVLLTMIMDQNPRTFPYHDPDWQAAAKFYAHQHLSGAIMGGLDEDQKKRVIINIFSVSPMVPLNTNAFAQPAKGLAIGFHVRGIDWDGDDDADGFGLAEAKPISLRGQLLDGGVSADGLTPSTAMVDFRLKCSGIKGKWGIKKNVWHPPILVKQAAAAAAAGGGSEGDDAAYTSMRTARRRALKTAAVRRRSEAAPSREEGEVSDTGESTASFSSAASKMRRCDLR